MDSKTKLKSSPSQKPSKRIYIKLFKELLTKTTQRWRDNSLNASGIKWLIAYQLTLIGMRVGKDVGGFIEMGCGYQGIVKAGLSLKF